MDTARTAILSLRKVYDNVWRTLEYEFEDAIMQVDDADLLLLQPRQLSGIQEALGKVRSFSDARRGRSRTVPVEPIKLSQEYDLFFFCAAYPGDIAYLESVQGWREKCRHAACFIVEGWSTRLMQHRATFERLLSQFDTIYAFNGASVPTLKEITGRPAKFLATATDCLTYCPVPAPGPERVIDVYSMGRRLEPYHEALLLLAEDPNFFYVHDTLHHGRVPSHAQHRRMVANTIKRSKFFMAHAHNVNMLKTTGGDIALSARQFEGAAGGAVLLGAPPACPEQEECFDWDDAGIPIPEDPRALGGFLTDLLADEARLAQIRSDNVVNSLQRHDWAHRYATILDDAGMKKPPKMLERLARLDQLAEDYRTYAQVRKY